MTREVSLKFRYRIQKILSNKILCSRSLRVFKEMLEKLGDDLGIMWGNIPDNPGGLIQF